MKVESYETPFRHWVADDLFPAAAVCAAYATTPPLEWGGWEARYENDCERGKRTVRRHPELSSHWARLFHRLNCWNFRNDLKGISGIVGLEPDPTGYGAGLHVTEPGGWLNCHLDYSICPASGLERRLNVILFCNPEWREEWGGAFELYDADARSVAKRIYPAFNRTIIWEGSDLAYHGTQQTAADAPARVTAAAYFMAPPRPGAVRRRALFAPTRATHQ